MKWKKPSRPMGVPVWWRNGNICVGEALKSAVRLTFPKGALLTGPEARVQHPARQRRRARR